VIGAFSLSKAEAMATALSDLPVERAFVVHGAMGWDEPTPVGPFHLFEVTPGRVRAAVRDPLRVGLPRCDPDSLRGGEAHVNARALSAVFAFSFYNEFAQYLAFAWTWSAASTYQYLAAWLILAVACFLHLREVGASRLWLKGALVTALLAVAVTVQTLQRSEAFSDSGRQITAHVLMPPAFRAVPFRDQAAFFGEIANLKSKLDSDRVEVRLGETPR